MPQYVPNNRVNPITKKKPRTELLEDIARAIQAIRMCTDMQTWSHANAVLDEAMTLAGFYTPNGELPAEHKSHIAPKINEWKNEIKHLTQKVKELERIIEITANPFGENSDPVILDGQGKVVPTAPINVEQEFATSKKISPRRKLKEA